MRKKKCKIIFDKVTLSYEVFSDKAMTLKETFVNLVNGKKSKSIVHNALKNISLEVNEGERVGIIGFNGSGKSSILKLISRIMTQQKGKIKVVGSVQPLIEIQAGFNPEFSGRENIYLNASMLGYTKKEIQRKENDIVEFTELGEYIDTAVKYYSSGMSVRLAFTIATSITPEILVIDEMLAMGDIKFIEKAEERLNSLIDKAKILLVVSHSLDFIKNITTRCLVMHKGQIIFDGPTKDALKFYVEHAKKKDLDKDA